MKAKTPFYILLYLIFCTGNAFAAAPYLYKTCPTNMAGIDSLVLFDKDCTSGFVFPSSSAKLSVNSALVSISEERCAAVKELEKTALGSFGDAADRSTRLIELSEQLSSKTQEFDRLHEEKGLFDLATKKLDLAHADLQSEVQELEAEFSDQCPAGQDDSFTCLAKQLELDKRKAEISENRTKSKQLKLIIDAKNADIEKVAAELSAISAESETLLNLPDGVETTTQEDAKTKLAELSAQNGITVSFSLTSQAQDHLEKIRSQNVGSDINYQEMRWLGGSLHMAPAILTPVPEANGFSQVSVPGLIEGDGTLFINASGAKLIMDVVATCRAFEYSRPDPSNLTEIGQAISANVVGKSYLSYSAIVQADIKITFNYEKFYEFLVRNRSKNGFFKKKTIKEVSDQLEAQSLFVVEFSQEGEVIGANEKEAIIQSLRNQLVQRALDAVGANYVGIDPNANPASASVGAPSVSSELRKCANKWCQAGAVAIDAAHSIFGGSEQLQQFTQGSSLAFEEQYSEGQPIVLSTDMTFVLSE